VEYIAGVYLYNMRPIITIFLLFITSAAAYAQTGYVIKGRITHDKTQTPVSGASIFISNSTRGTMSAQDGSFELTDVPTGKHDLVISCIGYSTVVYPYTGGDLPLQVDVKMKRKVSELSTVVVEPDEKDGWKKWGKFFMENFIGTNLDAQDCKVLNPEVLRFRFSKKNNTLTVIADEQLIIENQSLGYTIKYQMEEFNYSFGDRILKFTGYALFQDKIQGERLKRRWENSRERAYAGSIHHFMKSLYNNRLQEEGFEVRRMYKTPNTEKQRVRNILRESIRQQRETGKRDIAFFSVDSSEYYNMILRQPDEFQTVLPALLTADSLLSAGKTPDEKILFFKDFLFIEYKKEYEEEKYTREILRSPRQYYQRSTVVLPNLEPITVNKYGQYAPLFEFILHGYWAWSEKVASMLPLD